MSHAQYVFLPWLRTGLSRFLEGQAQCGKGQHRANLPAVTLQVNRDGHVITWDGSDDASRKPIQLYGPGDVVGFDQRIIVRTDPKPNVGDFEFNYFPLIEFSEPDFAWRMSPLAPQEDKLKPWICLIVLRAPDGQAGEKSPHGQDTEKSPDGQDTGKSPEFEPGAYDPELPCPFIKVLNKQSSLPDLKHAWLWAHMQVTASEEDAGLDPDRLQAILKESPERVICRLMCPRKLEPGTLYHAFVVPTFESGRLAGRGQDPSGVQQLDAPAWNTGDGGSVELPYYHKWEFRTSQRGDFEYLARLLKPRELGNEIGARPMDCSQPGYNVPGVNSLGLEGALRSKTFEPTPWPAETQDAFQGRLTELLNRPATQLREAPADAPPIVPPIYGKWHAAIKEITRKSPRWIRTLNLDPRYRVAAGLGTRVVRDQQEALMAAAWQQIGPIEEANQELRFAQLGREVSGRLLENKLRKLPRDVLIRTAAPVHSRVLIEQEGDAGASQKTTLKDAFEHSPVPAAVLDPAFRRVSRKRGYPRVRQQPAPDPDGPDLLHRINQGEIAGAGPAPSPHGTAGIGDISEDKRPWWAKGVLWAILKALPRILLVLAVVLYAVLWVLKGLGIPVSPHHPLALGPALLLALAAFIVQRLIVPGRVVDAVVEENLTEELVEKAKPPDDFTADEFSDPDEFRDFAASAQSFLNYAPPQEEPARPIDLDHVHSTLIETLKPERTIVSRLKRRIEYPDLENRPDPLGRIMDHPVFPQPMYEALRDLSQDYLLPGVQHVPQNSVGLLETNQRFVEAYMVGLNHEMGRELLWREYPTDQRGSYFRQFWDVCDTLMSQQEEEDLRGKVIADLGRELDQIPDEEQREQKIQAEIQRRWQENWYNIQPIHHWRDADLGQNEKPDGSEGQGFVSWVGGLFGGVLSGLRGGSEPENLVLLVRGDLLKKYPNTLIYAVQAEWKEIGDGEEVSRARRPNFDRETRFPIFRGTLPPDITFLGFDLEEDQARGSPQEGDDDPGWFFVFEERISEARFGLDAWTQGEDTPELSSWEDLCWGHLKELSASDYIDGTELTLDLEPEDGEPRWGAHAGAQASITFQKPVRIAIHADDMLPGSSAGQPS